MTDMILTPCARGFLGHNWIFTFNEVERSKLYVCDRCNHWHYLTAWEPMKQVWTAVS